MARPYDGDTHFAPPTGSTAAYDQADQALGSNIRSTSLPLYRPSTNTSPHNYEEPFELSDISVSYQNFSVGGDQQTRVGGGVPYWTDFSAAQHRLDIPIHNSYQPDLRLRNPTFQYGHGHSWQKHQHLLGNGTVPALHDPLSGLEVLNYADWNGNAFSDNTFVGCGIGSIVAPEGYVHEPMAEGSDVPYLESSPPPLDASSSQTRFACHHPQCRGLTFSRRADRDRHTRKHDNEKQYVCPIMNCGWEFYRKDKLQSHLRMGHQGGAMGL